jgi:hypothetical protein
MSQAKQRAISVTHRPPEWVDKRNQQTRIRHSKSTGNLAAPVRPFPAAAPYSPLCAIEKYASGDVALRDMLRNYKLGEKSKDGADTSKGPAQQDCTIQ